MVRIGLGLMALLIVTAGAGCDKRIREAGAQPVRWPVDAPALADDARAAGSQSYARL